MRTIESIGSTLILSLLVSSCLLQSVEKNFKQVSTTPNPKDQSSISYSYYDPNNAPNFYPLKDTIWLSNLVQIQFTDGKVLKTSILINNVVLPTGGATIQYSGGAYVIRRGSLPLGKYDLQIKQVVASGTGSLADVAGTELTEVTNTYVLIVEAANNYVPKINSILLQDGTIKLSWSQYRRDDFKFYKIIKVGSGYVPPKVEINILNPMTTTLTDTAYVGGSITYQLIVNNGGELSSIKYPFNYTYSPKALFTKLSTNTYRLSLTLPETYNNVKSYWINPGVYGVSSKTITSPINSNLLTMDFVDNNNAVRFGALYGYKIDLRAKVDRYTGVGDSTSNSNVFAIGQQIPFFDHVIHSPQKPVYYLINVHNTATMYRLDDQTYNVTDSVQPLLDWSRDGKILSSSNGQHGYIITDTQIQKFDLNTMSTIETSLFENMVPYFNYYKPSYHEDNTAISNNNFLLFKDDGILGSSYVIDMNTKTIVFKFSGSGHLSYDNKYLINGADLYFYSGSTFAKVSTLPYTSIHYEQFIDNTSQLLINAGTTVVIYDCVNNLELSSYPNVGWCVHLDQLSKKIVTAGTYGYGPLQIYDLNSGTVTSPQVYFGNNLLFVNDAFFDSYTYIPYGGYVLKNY